ncbi:hypothetical protein HDU85_005058 [Gaertneriomyces sp. JEL0708]|nr:hypothetical protein HDU85_005058 [Gaertneriomyces sp. JEL0708]
MTLAGSNVLESHHEGVVYSQQQEPQGNNYSYMENQQLNAFVLAQAQQQQQQQHQFDAQHHHLSPYTTTTSVQPSPFITLQSPYSQTQAYPAQHHHDSTTAFDMHSLLEGLKTPRENVVTPYSVLTTTPQIGLATPLTVLSTPHLGLVGLATPHTLLTTPLVAVDGTPHIGLVTPHTSVSTPQETHLLDELESELRQLGETGATTQGQAPDGDERAVAKLMEAVRRVKARQLGHTAMQQQQQQQYQSQLHGGSVGLGGDTQWGLPQALPTPPANELLGVANGGTLLGGMSSTEENGDGEGVTKGLLLAPLRYDDLGSASANANAYGSHQQQQQQQHFQQGVGHRTPYENVTTPHDSVLRTPFSAVTTPFDPTLPSPYTAVAPSPYTAVAPSPYTAVAPSPYTAVGPSPYTSVAPSPYTHITSPPNAFAFTTPSYPPLPTPTHGFAVPTPPSNGFLSPTSSYPDFLSPTSEFVVTSHGFFHLGDANEDGRAYDEERGAGGGAASGGGTERGLGVESRDMKTRRGKTRGGRSPVVPLMSESTTTNGKTTTTDGKPKKGASTNGNGGGGEAGEGATSNGGKVYQCSQCPRQFTRLYNLKSHEPIHSNARPYTCPHEGCTLSFLRKHDCKRHYESLHLSEEAKRFKCGNIVKDEEEAVETVIKMKGYAGTGGIAQMDKTKTETSSTTTVGGMRVVKVGEEMVSVPKGYKVCGTAFARCDALRRHEEKCSRDALVVRAYPASGSGGAGNGGVAVAVE